MVSILLKKKNSCLITETVSRFIYERLLLSIRLLMAVVVVLLFFLMRLSVLFPIIFIRPTVLAFIFIKVIPQPVLFPFQSGKIKDRFRPLMRIAHFHTVAMGNLSPSHFFILPQMQ